MEVCVTRKEVLGELMGKEIKYRASSKHSLNKFRKGFVKSLKESTKKTYIYYCPQEETLIESPFKHLKSVYMEVRTEDANQLFPWIEKGKIKMAIYAECFYMGIL